MKEDWHLSTKNLKIENNHVLPKINSPNYNINVAFLLSGEFDVSNG